MGLLLGLWRKAAPHLLPQPCAPLLRAHPRQRRRRALLVEELLAEARLGSETVRKLCGDLAYRCEVLEEVLAHRSVVLVTERAERRPARRQQAEICFAALKRAFGLGATLAKTLVGFATRIAAKITAYTYGFYVNRLLDRPQGHIKELWA